MMPYKWSLNRQDWLGITPMMIEHGQRVVINLINRDVY